MGMIKLYTPDNDVELAIITGLLDEAGILYHVQENHLHRFNMIPAPNPVSFRPAVYVTEQNIEQAVAIVRDFRKDIIPEEKPATKTKMSLWRRLRIIVEFILIGWIRPGRRKPEDQPTHK
jgi:hypothetical protein